MHINDCYIGIKLCSQSLETGVSTHNEDCRGRTAVGPEEEEKWNSLGHAFGSLQRILRKGDGLSKLGSGL